LHRTALTTGDVFIFLGSKPEMFMIQVPLHHRQSLLVKATKRTRNHALKNKSHVSLFLHKDLSLPPNLNHKNLEARRAKNNCSPHARFSTLKQAPQETPTSGAESPDNIPSTLSIFAATFVPVAFLQVFG
jgi:hypothetical protein